MNDLQSQVFSCPCSGCSAIVWLIRDRGALLRFVISRAGRLCELAVVGAAGKAGIAADRVVAARREYARLHGISLAGPISNSDSPVHIDHACKKHASNPINLGDAKAVFSGGRYYLL